MADSVKVSDISHLPVMSSKAKQRAGSTHSFAAIQRQIEAAWDEPLEMPSYSPVMANRAAANLLGTSGQPVSRLEDTQTHDVGETAAVPANITEMRLEAGETGETNAERDKDHAQEAQKRATVSLNDASETIRRATITNKLLALVSFPTQIKTEDLTSEDLEKIVKDLRTVGGENQDNINSLIDEILKALEQGEYKDVEQRPPRPLVSYADLDEVPEGEPMEVVSEPTEVLPELTEVDEVLKLILLVKSSEMIERMRTYWDNRPGGEQVLKALNQVKLAKGSQIKLKPEVHKYMNTLWKSVPEDEQEEGCEMRAHQICQEINSRWPELGASQLKKAWIFPQHEGHKLGHGKGLWGSHHVAPMLMDFFQWYVYDPILDKRLTVGQWRTLMGNGKEVHYSDAPWEVIGKPLPEGESGAGMKKN